MRLEVVEQILLVAERQSLDAPEFFGQETRLLLFFESKENVFTEIRRVFVFLLAKVADSGVQLRVLSEQLGLV